MFKRIALFVGGAILSCGVAFAQTSVTGKVVASEDGEPVIGASIKVAGTYGYCYGCRWKLQFECSSRLQVGDYLYRYESTNCQSKF